MYVHTNSYLVGTVHILSRGQKMMYKEGGYVHRTSYIGPWTVNRGGSSYSVSFKVYTDISVRRNHTASIGIIDCTTPVVVLCTNGTKT